jgi:hypothetical protein
LIIALPHIENEWLLNFTPLSMDTRSVWYIPTIPARAKKSLDTSRQTFYYKKNKGAT